MPILALWGYMGAGKTKLGKKLASSVGADFVDLDAYITEKSGETPARWIETKGELAFRKLERSALLDLLNGFEGVLSCGGGTPCYYNNAEIMLQKARCVYLSAPPAYLASRLLGEQSQRPLLQGLNGPDLPEFIAKHLFDRRPFYEQAHRAIRIDQLSEAERIAELKKEWQTAFS